MEQLHEIIDAVHAAYVKRYWQDAENVRRVLPGFITWLKEALAEVVVPVVGESDGSGEAAPAPAADVAPEQPQALADPAASPVEAQVVADPAPTEAPAVEAAAPADPAVQPDPAPVSPTDAPTVTDVVDTDAAPAAPAKASK